jgi:hypothetical protein
MVTAFLVVGSCLLSCRNNSPSDLPSFSGQRSFEYLQKQVSFGPRVPGTDNGAICRKYFREFLGNLGARIDMVSFLHIDKITGKEIPMINIIAHFRGKDANANTYLFAAHYDSRPRAEYDPDSTKRNMPIDGANDGASGIAVLMELANLISVKPPRANIDFALLDGEDWGLPGDHDEYFLGSKEFIKRSIKEKYKFVIVIDMIGDSDLKIYREEYSSRYSLELTNLIWNKAKKLGVNAFVDSIGYAILDDHISFMTIGLPSAVIIDFNYPYWHTTSDTPDKCSPKSLEAVGRVLTAIIYEL